MIAAEVLASAPPISGSWPCDTDLTPIDIGAFAQRGTIVTGNAVKNAALDARGQLPAGAARNSNAPPRTSYSDGRVSRSDDPQRS